MLLAINPVIFQLGPFAIRWYGLAMAISVAIGFFYLLRGARKLGYDEDFIYNLALIIVVAGIAGARLVYVATNWSVYAADPLTILRIDFGGLSFHGAVIGGILAGLPYLRRHGASFRSLADLAVPGLAVGIALVRLANIPNQEVVGRFTGTGFQHPAQLYGSAIGIVLLVINAALARRNPPPGYLFWSFAWYYTLLRGIFEETFRANPLYLGFWYTSWGGGFFTLTQLITPLLAAFTWWMRKRTVAAPSTGRDVSVKRAK